MKPLAIIALATTAVIGGSSFAGEQFTSFDGVGSMVLDMADEPTQVADTGHTVSPSHSDGGQCEETRTALEDRIDGMFAQYEYSAKLSETLVNQFDVDKIEARVEAAIAPFAVTVPDMKMVEVKVATRHNVQEVRREAVEEAQAAIEMRRHELKARIATVKNHQSRKALVLAEKALKRAQEALHR